MGSIKNLKSELMLTKSRIKGFTLIELMVVIVILGILATFAIQNFSGRTDQARVVKAKQDIRTLENALQLYKLDYFSFPSTEQGLEVLVNPQATTKGNTPEPYISRLPKDPWNRDYQYVYPGNHNPHSFDIFSEGADGKPQGEGVNADIGNWDDDHTKDTNEKDAHAKNPDNLRINQPLSSSSK